MRCAASDSTSKKILFDIKNDHQQMRMYLPWVTSCRTRSTGQR